MTPAPRRRTTRLGLAAAALPLLALAACGSDAADDPDDPGDPESASVTPTPQVSVTPEVTPTSEPASGDTPVWAPPATTPGDPLATLEAGRLRIRVSQVATAVATEDGSPVVDPRTGRPVPSVGDTLVVVNYVVTNTGAPFDLGSALVDITARYDDPPYVPMVGLLDDALYGAQGVNEPLVPSAPTDTGVFTLGTGQRYSFSRNFPYRQGAPITFAAVATPVDTAGEPVFDEQVEAEARATLR